MCEIYVSKIWETSKCCADGWSGCGHPACVRLKVGRGRQQETQAEHPWKLPDPCSACPRAKLCPSQLQLPGRGLISDGAPWGVMRAKSTGQENPGALSVRGLNQAVWHVGTTGVGQTVDRSGFQASFWGSPQRDWCLNTLGKALARGSGCQGYFVCCCPFG